MGEHNLIPQCTIHCAYPNNFDADFHFQEPINLVKLRYFKMSRKVCHPENAQSQELDIVIVVKSGVGNFKRRNRFRQFYENERKLIRSNIESERFEFIFAIGLPRYNNKTNEQDPDERANPGEFNDVESYNAAMRDLVEEMKIHDDLLVGDFEDSYRNLSMKMQFYYTWAATFCRGSRPTFLFVDDDVAFSLPNFVAAIHSFNVSQRAGFLHGSLTNGNSLLRSVNGTGCKWSILKTEVPWPWYTPYFSGYYNIVGFEQIEKLSLGMLFTKYISVDDAWLGLLAARMGLRLHLIDEIIQRSLMFSTHTRFPKLP